MAADKLKKIIICDDLDSLTFYDLSHIKENFIKKNKRYTQEYSPQYHTYFDDVVLFSSINIFMAIISDSSFYEYLKNHDKGEYLKNAIDKFLTRADIYIANMLLSNNKIKDLIYSYNTVDSLSLYAGNVNDYKKLTDFYRLFDLNIKNTKVEFDMKEISIDVYEVIKAISRN